MFTLARLVFLVDMRLESDFLNAQLGPDGSVDFQTWNTLRRRMMVLSCNLGRGRSQNEMSKEHDGPLAQFRESFKVKGNVGGE